MHLRSILDSKPNVIDERFMFRKWSKNSRNLWNSRNLVEPFWQYLVKLERLSEICEFVEYRKESIRDRFGCGLKVRSIHLRKLLSGAPLTPQFSIEKVVRLNKRKRKPFWYMVNLLETKWVEVLITFFDVGNPVTPRKIAFIGKPIIMDATSWVTLYRSVRRRKRGVHCNRKPAVKGSRKLKKT